MADKITDRTEEITPPEGYGTVADWFDKLASICRQPDAEEQLQKLLDNHKEGLRAYYQALADGKVQLSNIATVEEKVVSKAFDKAGDVVKILSEVYRNIRPVDIKNGSKLDEPPKSIQG